MGLKGGVTVYAEIFSKEKIGWAIFTKEAHKRQGGNILHGGEGAPRLAGNHRFRKRQSRRAVIHGLALVLLVLIEDLLEDQAHVIDRIEHFLRGVDGLLRKESEDDRVARAGIDLHDFLTQFVVH